MYPCNGIGQFLRIERAEVVDRLSYAHGMDWQPVFLGGGNEHAAARASVITVTSTANRAAGSP